MVKKIAFGTMAFVLAIAIAEAVVRVMFTSPSAQQFDDELGYTYRPNANLMLAAEGGAYRTVNALGLLDDEVNSQSKQVVVLGDSIAEAKQVEQEQSFHQLVEKELPNVGVLNAGFASFNPAHYPIVLERLIKAGVEPAAIVVFLHDGESLGLVNGGATIVEQDGKIAAIKPKSTGADGVKRILAPLIDRSALAVHLIRKLKPAIESYKSSIKRTFKSSPEATLPQTETTLEEKLSHFGVERAAFILEQLKAQSSAPVIVIYIESLNYMAGRRWEVSSTLGELLLFQQAAKRANVDFYDLTAELAAFYEATGVPPIGFANKEPGVGHLNENGHRVIADALIRLLPHYVDAPISASIKR